MKKLVGKFGQRYNTAAIWEYVNPILIEGEMGIESDTNLFKFGDGVTPWNDLEYAGGGGANAVDATLTKSGMAADAKVTGDRIAAIDAKMFTGTKEEYKSAYAAGLIAIGTIVNITDDEELTDEDDDSGGEGETESFIVSVLPEPTVLYRGRIFILDNGTEDVPYICLKKSGAYGWYKFNLYSSQDKESLTKPEIFVTEDGDKESLAKPEIFITENGDDETSSAVLGVAKLGIMILGHG